MKIEGSEPEMPGKPKSVEQASSMVRIVPVTEAEMAKWSPRRRDEWAQLGEEDRNLWKLIHDEVRNLMDGPDGPVGSGEPAPESRGDDDIDMEAAAKGLLRALMEEWEYDRWERAQGDEGVDEDEEDPVP